jgi:hypothetical protein
VQQVRHPSTLRTGYFKIMVEQIMRKYLKQFTVSLLLVCLHASAASAANAVRGPYLQTATPTSIIVKWRTDDATNSVVRFGTSSTGLDEFVSAASDTSEHEITLINLLPNTRYYYSIGTDAETIAGDSSYTFKTPPVEDTVQATQIWVIGDAGTAYAEQYEVRDAYADNLGLTGTDLWLMLGDNAYEDGSDADFQVGVFDVYEEMLRQSPIWPVFGNHDAHDSDSKTETGPYYDIFSLPRNGEAGGLPSGTEAYYSFDYGNIHFVALDSADSSTVSDSVMLTWLENDLAATSKEWIIAFWHHPPYSEGYHDSDDEGSQIRMRENAVPILEEYNVDLVLSGHNHTYERSYLISGHHGHSNTFNSSMQIDDGSGQENDTGAYLKPLNGPYVNNAGAVYVVSGSSGKMNKSTLGDHPAMYAKLESLGSMVLNVEGSRLDATFVNENGVVRDSFTISKQPIPLKAKSQIAQETDDAEETVKNGRIQNSSSDLEIVWDSKEQLIGLRFTDIPLEKIAIITAAWVQFTADETDSGTISLVIEGEANPAPASFTSADRISQRVRTQANVAWSPAAWDSVGAADTDQQTPNLAPILSEIINATNWSTGDAIALIISGTGKRVAVAHDNGSGTVADAAVLHIEYTYQSTRAVDIDILPEDPQNVVPALYSDTPLAVSVLSTSIADGDTEDFNATLVDGNTVRFGIGSASAIDPAGIVADVDADGDMDYTFNFATNETGIACEDTSAPLIGSTELGSDIEGVDSVSTPDCPRCHNP